MCSTNYLLSLLHPLAIFLHLKQIALPSYLSNVDGFKSYRDLKATVMFKLYYRLQNVYVLCMSMNFYLGLISDL